jgi:hypothetical protein
MGTVGPMHDSAATSPDLRRGVPDSTKQLFSAAAFAEEILCRSFRGPNTTRRSATIVGGVIALAILFTNHWQGSGAAAFARLDRWTDVTSMTLDCRALSGVQPACGVWRDV